MSAKIQPFPEFTTCQSTRKLLPSFAHKNSKLFYTKKLKRMTLIEKFSGDSESSLWQVSWVKNFSVLTFFSSKNSTLSLAVFFTQSSNSTIPCANCTWKKINFLRKANCWYHSYVIYFRSKSPPLSQNLSHKWNSKNINSSLNNTSPFLP